VEERRLIGWSSLCTFTSDSSGKLNVLWHDSDSLGVDSTEIGIFEQRDKVSFSCFLESQDSIGLESEVTLVVLSNFSDKSLERKLSDQEFSRLLVLSDFSESDCTWLISVRLLETTSAWSFGGLSCGLGGELLSWCLTTSGFSCCLLGSGHCVFWLGF